MATAKQPNTTSKASAGRVRSARSDALVVRMQATIEAAFGLPEGSVKLVGPKKGSKLDESSTVGDLRSLWQK
jgi:hypothetical protein